MKRRLNAIFIVQRISHLTVAVKEFICDKIMIGQYESVCGYIGYNTEWGNSDCLSPSELFYYGFPLDTIYGWHISDLIIYETPKNLANFKRSCNGECERCLNYEVFQRWGNFVDAVCTSHIVRPPQSWCYVDEEKRKEQ